MAKLVAVCRDEADFAFERRQIPLNIEDTLTVWYIVSIVFISFEKEYVSVRWLSDIYSCGVVDGHGNSRNCDFNSPSQRMRTSVVQQG